MFTMFRCPTYLLTVKKLILKMVELFTVFRANKANIAIGNDGFLQPYDKTCDKSSRRPFPILYRQ